MAVAEPLRPAPRLHWPERPRRHRSPLRLPTPSPLPNPVSSVDTAQYSALAAVVSAKAAYPYDRGIIGKGVTIVVFDTGISPTTSEFAGSILADGTGFEQRTARFGMCLRRHRRCRLPQSLHPLISKERPHA